jgi:DNA polymerase-3 subunit alpha
MGKKDKEKMAKERVSFVQGCAKTNGIPEDQANAIFDFIAKFAEYGFNKSHSAAYGLISYQTAWLKAHYPVEFMAGLLSNDLDKTDKLSGLIAECRRMGIAVLPPDVNESGLKFTPSEENGGRAIRFGLAAIKNVGAGAMELALAERANNGPFTSLADFCARLDSRTVNRKIIESLVKCGAFDSLGVTRATLFTEIESAMAAAAQVQRDRASGQASLFDALDLAEPPPTVRESAKVEEWPRHELLAQEKELLGFYVTGHPLDEYAGSLESTRLRPINTLEEIEGSETVQIGGIISTLEKKFTRKDNKPFAVFLLEDFTGTVEVTAWSETLQKSAELLQVGQAVTVSARVSRNEENLRVMANSVGELKKRASRRPVVVRLRREATREDDLQTLLRLARENRGKRPLEIVFIGDSAGPATIRAGEAFTVGDESALRAELGKLLPHALAA